MSTGIPIAKRVRDRMGNFFEKVLGYITKPGREEIVSMAPHIIRFAASRDFTDGSSPVVLSWEVEHADHLTLNGMPVTGIRIEVNPQSDTRYILTASNQYDIEGEVSEPILVRVDKTPPFIHYFRINPQMVKGGEPVELSWQVAGAASIEIEGIGTLQGNSYLYVPRQDTILTLRATSFTGVQSSTHAGVEVDKTPPVIHRFEASPTVLPDVRPVRLVWETEGAELVRIADFGDFPPSGETELAVRKDTVLNFLAISHYGVAIPAQVEITTSKVPPVILAFKTNRPVLTDETPSRLFWDVSNAVRIEIDNGVGEVTSQLSQSVHSMTDKVYTLTAWSYFGVPASASLEIRTDRTPPKILSFKSDKEFVFTDYHIHLEWEAPEAYRVTLYPEGINVDKSGSFKTNIRRDTRFKLVAANYFGVESYAEVLVRIIPIPVIETLWVPGFSVEEKIKIMYDRLDPTRLPSNTVQFNNQLLVEPLRMTEIKLEMFHPPLEAQYESLADMIRNIYKEYIPTAFDRIKQIIREKMGSDH